MEKQYDLERFVKAQEQKYDMALQEIKGGKKRTHWMWYVFPQLRALGASDTSVYYGIADIGEARAYIAHPVLGARLREISEALYEVNAEDIKPVMGYPDYAKLRSSMTLFCAATEDNGVFRRVLERYYGGHPDDITLSILEEGEEA